MNLYIFVESVFIFCKKEGNILIFNITIEEVISQNFNIEANTYNEAISIAKEKYNNGEYVLEPGNLLEKRIAVLNGKNCEWIEF